MHPEAENQASLVDMKRGVGDFSCLLRQPGWLRTGDLASMLEGQVTGMCHYTRLRFSLLIVEFKAKVVKAESNTLDHTY